MTKHKQNYAWSIANIKEIIGKLFDLHKNGGARSIEKCYIFMKCNIIFVKILPKGGWSDFFWGCSRGGV